mmetsp:Transcript_18335/g.55333  ORF Transcript_18335/g.55333 Transcript_18335/m.55333 type:complete len:217 (+) Transcript_18335:1612-2262(+)
MDPSAEPANATRQGVLVIAQRVGRPSARSSCHGLVGWWTIQTARSPPPEQARRIATSSRFFPFGSSPSCKPYATRVDPPSAVKATSTGGRASKGLGSAKTAERVAIGSSDLGPKPPVPPALRSAFSAQSASITAEAEVRKRFKRAVLALRAAAVRADSETSVSARLFCVLRSSGAWHACSSLSTSSVCVAASMSSSCVCTRLERNFISRRSSSYGV